MNIISEESMQSYLLCALLLLLPFSLFAMPKGSPLTDGYAKVIILLGPPASGKGTQGARLAKELNIPHISTGDLFRENMSKETPLGKQAKSYITAGKLVPDEIVLDMLFERLKENDADHGYILDGFPRTLPQAEALNQRMGQKNTIIALNLDVSDETIIKRTAGRLMCKECTNVHNLFYSPPKVSGKCDICEGQLYQREDDKPEVVKTRLNTYHEQTAPLIEYYRKKGILQNIDGEQAPDKVFQDLKRAVSGN